MAKPTIRFRGFDDEWEQRKFDDLADYKKGPFGSALKKDMFVPKSDMTVKVYEQQNAINKDWHLERYFITEEYANKLSGFRVEGGDIIVSCAGTIGETYEIPLDAEPGIINQALMRIKVKESIVNKKMFNILFTNMIDDFTRVHSNGSAIKNIPPFSDLKPMVVFVPKMDEQNKISSYFSNLDHLITLHQRKCDETKKLKKYILQKMFPQNGRKVPEIRFKGFTDEWEQRKLEEFGKATGGTSIESEFSEDGIYKVISIGSYSENSVYNDQGIRAIKSDKTSNRVLNRNNLTMILNDKTTSGNIIGRVLLIEESGIYVYNQRTERIEINLDEYDPVFLYEMLNAPNIREKIIKQAQGNTQIYVNWTAISLLEYMIPSKEEQVKIGEYLHSISNLITLHQHKCEELKKLKKFMLQNMFTQKNK